MSAAFTEKQVLRESRYFLAFIQAVLVGEVSEIARNHSLNDKEAGVLALIHGIALAFIDLEKLYRFRRIDQNILLRMKEELIMQNLAMAYGKGKVTNDQIEKFAGMIYEVLGRIPDAAELEDAALEERLGDLLCEYTGLEEEKEDITDKVRTLHAYFRQETAKKFQ